MTSPPHLLYNTTYHIYNRGINGENIFLQEQNFAYFLTLYSKYIDPFAFTYAYCLLRNHFHLLLKVKSKKTILSSIGSDRRITQPVEANTEQRYSLNQLFPSSQFSHFFNAYAKAINAKYGRTGSLFQHPFRRVIVNNEEQFYRTLTYIHQNPQKHGLIDNFREWKYSSYGVILKEKHSAEKIRL